MSTFKATILYSWAFSWINNPEVKELFDYVNLSIKLPDRRILSADQLGVTLIYDSWKNIKKESLLRIALINSREKTLIWGAENLLEK
ncbi:22102_t:CDS:2 [Gigaspora margarita]|uniref:22102_t:CDS:1 n=1 Tax=Gigaspora margarita TaxID=4874 RepID=A0ABN7VW99_GIGMA|nr:22102_t:CDS:2 [Gigaspora margarita]